MKPILREVEQNTYGVKKPEENQDIERIYYVDGKMRARIVTEEIDEWLLASINGSLVLNPKGNRDSKKAEPDNCSSFFTSQFSLVL